MRSGCCSRRRQVPRDIEIGDPVEVFLYRDSDDRMIATTHEPKVTLGKLAILEVADVGTHGRLSRLGAGKGLIPPLQGADGEAEERAIQCLVTLYIDKSEQALRHHESLLPMLRTDSPYKKDDKVSRHYLRYQ